MGCAMMLHIIKRLDFDFCLDLLREPGRIIADEHSTVKLEMEEREQNQAE